MRKPVVVIIKASPWKSAHLSSHHPEFSAISHLVKRYRSKFHFVLVGSSSDPTARVQLKNGIVAWDIKTDNKLGFFTYHFHLMRLLLQYRPDIVIVLGMLNILPVAFYSLFTRRSKYIPVFVGEFGYHGSKSIGRFLVNSGLKALGICLELSERKILRSFTLSRHTCEGIEKLAPKLGGKIRLISYPINSRFNAQKYFPSKPPTEPIVLTVAAIDPRKGLDTLIKAASLVPKKFRVIVKGSIRDAVYMQKLNELVSDLNLQDRVTFITDRIDYDALVSYYRSATLFVFPTRDDCLGVALLEALHCRVPVIATCIGGIPDMIVDRLNGILVRPDDPLELANAISSLLDNDALRKKLARNAKRVLFSRYYKRRTTLKNALDSLLCIYGKPSTHMPTGEPI